MRRSTYRTGAKFGPNAIREASFEYLKLTAYEAELTLRILPCMMLETCHVSLVANKTIDMTRLVVEDILAANKMAGCLRRRTHNHTWGR